MVFIPLELGLFYLDFGGDKMSCRYFECENLNDNICQADIDENECIGDLCDIFGQCSRCQKKGQEECPRYDEP